jgi:trigger factor
VQVTTDRQENCIVKLTIAVDERQSNEYMRRAARTLSRRYRIPGFRPGKAPYGVVVRNLGVESVQSQVLEQFGDQVFEQGLKESELNPIAEATLDDVTWEPFTLHLTVPIEPEVELGDYQELRVPWQVAEVTDQDLEDAVQRLREEQAEPEPKEGTAELGDHIVADITAKIEDDVVLENTARELILSAESPYPVPGFAEAVVGMSAGETRTLTLSYPEDHYNADVAGQEAEFEVHISEIRSEVLPELDDEFAMSVGDYEDLDDLKTKLRQSLVEQAESQAESDFEEKMWEKLLEVASFQYPEIAVDREIDAFQEQFAAQMRQQGIDLESFWQLTGTTQEEWREQIRPQALERMKRRLVLGKIVQAESFEVSDDEVEAEIEEMLAPLGDRADDMRELLASEAGKASVTDNLLTEKALDYLKTLLRQDVETEAIDGEQEGAADEQEAIEDQQEATADIETAAKDEQEAIGDELAATENGQQTAADELVATEDEQETAADELEAAADERSPTEDEPGADAKDEDVKDA